MEIDIKIKYRQTDRQTSQTDRQTDKQTDQTDRQGETN